MLEDARIEVYSNLLKRWFARVYWARRYLHFITFMIYLKFFGYESNNSTLVNKNVKEDKWKHYKRYQKRYVIIKWKYSS